MIEFHIFEMSIQTLSLLEKIKVGQATGNTHFFGGGGGGGGGGGLRVFCQKGANGYSKQ